MKKIWDYLVGLFQEARKISAITLGDIDGSNRSVGNNTDADITKCKA